MEGRTNGGFVYHTECALWTLEHHVKLGTEHVEYIVMENILPLHQQKHLHVFYIPMPFNVNKIITIRLTLISKAVTWAKKNVEFLYAANLYTMKLGFRRHKSYRVKTDGTPQIGKAEKKLPGWPVTFQPKIIHHISHACFTLLLSLRNSIFSLCV